MDACDVTLTDLDRYIKVLSGRRGQNFGLSRGLLTVASASSIWRRLPSLLLEEYAPNELKHDRFICASCASRVFNQRRSVSCDVKAKFHYASWFGAGSEPVRS